MKNVYSGKIPIGLENCWDFPLKPSSKVEVAFVLSKLSSKDSLLLDKDNTRFAPCQYLFGVRKDYYAPIFDTKGGSV